MIKHLPNVVTSLNVIAGVVGIYWIATTQRWNDAIIFVGIGAFFDFADGLVARGLKAYSDIGKQLDSLADVITFGALPSIFMMGWIDEAPVKYLGALVAVFSALRLAKFNIDNSQEKSFKGLPTPANAIMITSLFLLPYELNVWGKLILIIVSCYLMVSNVSMLSLKFSNIKWNGNEARWILIFGAILLFLVFKMTFLSLIIPFYIVVSLSQGLYNRIFLKV